MKPLVSICCITYNHEKFIAQAIEGFLMQQTSFPFEVIIHDDASTDQTAAIIKEYEVKYPEIIKPIYQKENQYSKGIKPSPTFVWPRARGKYIALCEGDDYWTDQSKLQKQVDFLEQNNDFIMCFTNGRIVSEEGIEIQNSQIINTIKHEFSLEDIPFTAPTHTRVFKNFDIKLLPELFYKVRGADTFLTSWLIQFGKVKYLDFVSSSYRLHSGGIHSSLSEFDKKLHILESRLHILKLLKIRSHKKLNSSIYNYFDKAGSLINNNDQFIAYLLIYRDFLPLFGFKEKIIISKLLLKKIILISHQCYVKPLLR